MNRNRLFLIGLAALALGAFASLTVYKGMKGRSASPAEAGVEVVIAAQDLPVGAKIEEKDLKVVRFPATDLPSNYIRHTSSILGRGVILPITKGEFILPNKLAAPNAGAGLVSLIPPGMRAMSVRVNEVVSVAGFVQPGTRVDVMWTGNAGNGLTQTTTLLENVAVIATGQKLEHSALSDASTAPVITLLVSPDDAQKLALASTQGHLQLALRNPLDTKQQDLLALRSNVLNKDVSAPIPVAPRPRVRHVATQPAPAAPSVYEIEVYRGDKKDVTKF